MSARLIAWPFHNGLPDAGGALGPARLLQRRSETVDWVTPTPTSTRPTTPVCVLRRHGAGDPHRRGGVEHWAHDLPRALDELHERVSDVYLQVDVDSLDPSEGVAHRWAAPGGLTVAQVLEAIAAVRERFTVRAAAITAFDPAQDDGGRMARSAGRILDALVDGA